MTEVDQIHPELVKDLTAITAKLRTIGNANRRVLRVKFRKTSSPGHPGTDLRLQPTKYDVP